MLQLSTQSSEKQAIGETSESNMKFSADKLQQLITDKMLGGELQECTRSNKFDERFQSHFQKKIHNINCKVRWGKMLSKKNNNKGFR